MLKDGKYRFTLQFSAKTAEEVNAGELLQKLGHKKSAVVILALNDYLKLHPELMDPKVTIRVEHKIPKMDFDAIETKIREIVEEKVSGLHVDPNRIRDDPGQPETVRDDILDMLEDLSLFG